MTTDQHADAFLGEEVEQWSSWMLQRLQQNVRTGANDNAEFLGSLAVRATREALQRYRVQLSFVRHGRFADMGAGRGYSKGQYIGTAARGEMLKGRKGNKVYSRTAYGTLSTLMHNVANKYIQLAPELIKETLTHGHTN